MEGDVVSVTVGSEAGTLLAHRVEALDRYAERTVKRTIG